MPNDLVLSVTWNHGGEPGAEVERLSCLLCNRGEGDHETPTEYLVTFRTRFGQSVTTGLHQECLAKNERSAKGGEL